MSTTAPGPGPTFSVLTTAYRTEDTVGRAIGAVLDQTVADWELVVVDNGRSDAMAAVVAPFTVDPRIHLVRQENRGAAGGIAAAATHATGRWLVVLNSDDHVAPTFLARMLEVIAAHPDVAAVTCDAVRFSDTEPDPPGSYLETAGQRGTADPSRPLRVADVVDGPCPYYTAAIRRDVWDSVGGMTSLRPDTSKVSDLDFWLRLLVTGHDVRTVPDRLGRFRIEAGSVSRPDDDAAADELDVQVEGVLRRAVERTGAPEDEAALERTLARRRREAAVRHARAALREGSTARARRHYDEAWRLGPDVRLAVVRAGLRVAPPLVGLAYRVKQRWGRR
ncbi:glycosyltransferase family 2 protein [Nocardioides sp. CFH 31398]|uniref:glycosyltransferase family 2 protein n=1 Tax=Nocardioides sp. CFH 31398 TaxID=2919579 RepID=UPI001F06A2F6|nr:glycosyltransferase family 2 protein [Nocardioides sp. CFH 31398]MCH1867669.1 glycosyltransferase [Nocardioides sp. CFH 31398]